MTCHVIDASTVGLSDVPLEQDQVKAGAPRVAVAELLETATLEVGVWEHTVGVSTDVESDEVFVVLSGRATVDVDDGTCLELRPGVVGFLDAGAETTWTIHETLRKVYVVPAGDPAAP